MINENKTTYVNPTGKIERKKIEEQLFPGGPKKEQATREKGRKLSQNTVMLTNRKDKESTSQVPTQEHHRQRSLHEKPAPWEPENDKEKQGKMTSKKSNEERKKRQQKERKRDRQREEEKHRETKRQKER